jgi:hypothetical protein
MKRFFCALVVLSLALACQPENRETRRAPQTVEEFTQAIIREVQQVIRDTDAQLVGRPAQVQHLPAAEAAPSYRLELWTENERAVKLAATPEGGAAATAYYFANDELFFVAQPAGKAIFIGGELKYWLGPDWQPLPGEEAARQGREAALLRQAQAYLAAFE